MTWDKEDVYDNEILPLMVRIVEICKREQVPCLCVFQYADTEDDGPQFCTTRMTTFDGTAQELKDIGRQWTSIVTQEPTCLAETVTTQPDGSKRIDIKRIS